MPGLLGQKNVAGKDGLTEGSEVPAGIRGGSSVTTVEMGQSGKVGDKSDSQYLGLDL